MPTCGRSRTSSFPLLLFAWAIVRFEVAEGVLYSRQHMRHKWSREIDLFIVPMRFVENAAIANPLNVTQCVVAIGAPRSGWLFCLIFRAHLLVIDAGQDMDTLAAERFLREGIRLVYNLIAAPWKHG